MSTATQSFVTVGKTGDLKNGTIAAYTVGGKEIFVAMVEGKYYAGDKYCPHMGGDLSQGHLTGTILTCPRHTSKFDLVDGRVVRWTDWTGIKASVSKLFKPPRPLHTYRVKIEGDNILVET